MSQGNLGERVAALEAGSAARNEMMAMMHQGIVENAAKADKVHADLLKELRANQSEIKALFRTAQEAQTKQLNAQDETIDDCDRRLSAMENQKKGALAIIGTFVAAVSGLAVWAADQLKDLFTGGT